ncbi:hypothetical protein AB0323_00060 [Arthrobacter sp. NPDC080031]|uniref:hypothetical protein n=1 Tax=Arthrobacter sp. NPDC080031 TaxID=3155918 RepID=UPI00344EDE4D
MRSHGRLSRDLDALVSMQAAFHCYWIGGGLTGVLLGSLMPGPVKGLDFALCALFVTLTVDACAPASKFR